MKRYLFTLAVVVLVAAASYAITRRVMEAPEETPATWLQREFKLSDAQLAAVEKLQADYEPICAEHCSLVMEARERLRTSPSDPALNAEVFRLKKTCVDATAEHLRQVAAQMAPDQGRRFLALMQPKLSGHDHAKPLGLQ